MARQPALKQVPKSKCTTKRASWRKDKKGKWQRVNRGSLKRGCKVKNGKYYQVRRYRKCGKMRAKAFYKGVVVVAPCNTPMSDALKKRAWNTYSDKNWDACARKNSGIKNVKKAPCRVIFFQKGKEPIMRGKGPKGIMKRKARARWARLPKTFKKKFREGAYR
jgi:hypothetical protein